MKTLSPLFLLCLLLFAGGLNAQRVVQGSPGQPQNAQIIIQQQINRELGNVLGPQPAFATPATNNSQNANGSNFRSNKTSVLSNVSKLGTASNAYSILQNRSSQIATWGNISDGTGLVAFIHRQDVSQYGGGVVENGVYRVDWSRDQGLTWPVNGSVTSLNAGPLNATPYPNNGRPRYPQIAVSGTAGQPSDSLDFGWVGPMTDGTNWGNYIWGNFESITTMPAAGSTVHLPNTHYSFLAATNNQSVIIPGGMTAGKTGEFWFTDQSYDPASGKGKGDLLLYKGVVNDQTNVVTWSLYKSIDMKPFLAPVREAKTCTTTTDVNLGVLTDEVAFSPDGMTGWAVVSGDVLDTDMPGSVGDGNKNHFQSESDLLLVKSTDGGANWTTTPIIVKLRNLPLLRDSILTYFQASKSYSSGIPYLFTMDMAVDKNGNPHIMVEVANNAGINKCDSLGFYTPGAAHLVGDITTPDGGKNWFFKLISYTSSIYGTVPSSSSLTFFNHVQVSRSADGSKIFYGWVDDSDPKADATLMKPDLMGRALDVDNEQMTPVMNYSVNDPDWGGKVYYPQIAQVMFNVSSDPSLDYRVPVVAMQVPGTDVEPVQFWYFGGIGFKNSSMMVPKHDLSLTAISSPGTVLCKGAGTQNVTVKFKNLGTSVADTMYLVLNVSGPISMLDTVQVVRNLATSDTSSYTFANVDFSKSGTYQVSVLSLYHGDWVVANNVITQTVVSAGGATGDLFPASVNGCGSYLLDVNLRGATVDWNNGQSSAQTFTVTSSQSVTVSVTVPGCAGTLNDTVNVVINPKPTITVASAEVCANSAATSLTADNTNAANRSYHWQVNQIDNSGSTLSTDTTANTFSFGSGRGYWIAYVTVTDKGTGCPVTDTITVKRWAVDANLTSLNNQSFCGKPYITAINASTYPGAVYTWTIDDTLNGSNSGNQTLFRKMHKYSVKISSPVGGCTTDTDVATITESDSVHFDRTKFSGWIMCSPNDSVVLGGTVPINTEVRVYANIDSRITDTGDTLTPYDVEKWTIYQNTYLQTGSVKYHSPGTLSSSGSITYVNNSDYVSMIFKSVPAGSTQMFIRFDLGSGKCTQNVVQNFSLTANKSAVCSVSVPGTLSLDNLNVYPNPSNGRYVLTGTLDRAEALTLRVVDLTGREVYHRQLAETADLNAELDLTGMAPGLYMLHVQSANGAKAIRLVKE